VHCTHYAARPAAAAEAARPPAGHHSQGQLPILRKDGEPSRPPTRPLPSHSPHAQARPASPATLTPTTRGGDQVFNSDERFQTAEGAYVHKACAPHFAAPGLPGPVPKGEGPFRQPALPERYPHRQAAGAGPDAPDPGGWEWRQAPAVQLQPHSVGIEPGLIPPLGAPKHLGPHAGNVPRQRPVAGGVHMVGGGSGVGVTASPKDDTEQERERLFTCLRQGGDSTPEAYRGFQESGLQNSHERHAPNPPPQQRHFAMQEHPAQQAGMDNERGDEEGGWRLDPSKFWEQKKPLMKQSPPPSVPQYLPERLHQAPAGSAGSGSWESPLQQESTPAYGNSPTSSSKGIIKLPSPPGLQVQHGHVEASNVPAYPFMGYTPSPVKFAGTDGTVSAAAGHELAAARTSAHLAVTGNSGDCDAQVPVIKGMCAVCGQPVHSYHVRTKDARGNYVHGDRCAAMAGMQPPPPPDTAGNAMPPMAQQKAVVVNINGHDVL